MKGHKVPLVVKAPGCCHPFLKPTLKSQCNKAEIFNHLQQGRGLRLYGGSGMRWFELEF